MARACHMPVTFRPFCGGRDLAYCSTADAGASLWRDGRQMFCWYGAVHSISPLASTPKLIEAKFSLLRHRWVALSFTKHGQLIASFVLRGHPLPTLKPT